MSEFVEFVREFNYDMGKYIKMFEDMLYINPSSSIVEGRKFLEVLINEIGKFEKYDKKFFSMSLYEKIKHIEKDGILDEYSIKKKFDNVRITGNNAAHHTNENKISAAFIMHEELFDISLWFYELYYYTQLKINKPFYKLPIHQVLKADLNNTKTGEKEIKSHKLKDSSFSEQDKIKIKEPNKEIIDFQEEELSESKSYLIKEINKLDIGSKEAIESEKYFSDFKQYLHIKTDLEEKLLDTLKAVVEKNEPSLVFLCGNVGDGKSHLLGYLNKAEPDLMKKFTVFNDATEGMSPHKNSLDTLEERLSIFSDEQLRENEKNILIAINRGVLHNFVENDQKIYSYNRLKEFINNSKIFEEQFVDMYEEKNFKLIGFGKYQNYTIHDNTITLKLYKQLLEKITSQTEQNPFYLAYQNDLNRNVHTIVHQNYKFLSIESVQEAIIKVLVNSIIQDKLIVSTRTFLNFVHNILMPKNKENKLEEKFKVIETTSEAEKLQYILPNLLFNQHERNSILFSVSILDPVNSSTKLKDKIIIDLNSGSSWQKLSKKYLKNEMLTEWFDLFFMEENIHELPLEEFLKTYIRTLFLVDNSFYQQIAKKNFEEYLTILYGFNGKNMDIIESFYSFIQKSIFKWKGQFSEDYLIVNNISEKFFVAQKLSIKPNSKSIKKLMDINEMLIYSIPISFETNSGHTVDLQVDFKLYDLLKRLQEGYCVTLLDVDNAVNFVEFVDKVIEYGSEKDEILIYFKKDKVKYTLEKTMFNKIEFKKEGLS